MSADFVGQLLTRSDNIVEKNGTDLNGTITTIGGGTIGSKALSEGGRR
jgi:hypothetical protein